MSPPWSVHLAALPFVFVDMVGETDYFHIVLSTEAQEKSR